VKDLDRSLYHEDEIGTLFEEMMNTLPKDHLETNIVRSLMTVY